MKNYSKWLSTLMVASLAIILSTAQPVLAQVGGKALPVYTDGLQAGWQSWSWAKVELSVPAGTVKPIKVEGDPWSALFLHHDAISTTGYSKLVFYVNGGLDGGQTLYIKASSDGKFIDSNYQVVLKAKTWNKVEVPLSEIGAADRSIDGIVFQGGAQPYTAYYITKIEFE